MSTLFRLAWRNFLRQRKRHLWLAAALSLAYFFILLVLGLSEGLSANVDLAASRHYAGHVYLWRYVKQDSPGDSVRDYGALKKVLAESPFEIRNLVKRSFLFDSTYLYYNGESVRLKRVDGIDLKVEVPAFSSLTMLEGSVEGLAAEGGILLSEGSAKALGASLGSRILLQGLTIQGHKNTAERVVTGIFRDANIFGYYKAYVDLAFLNGFLGVQPEDFMMLGIYLGKSYDQEALRAYLQKNLAGSFGLLPLPENQKELNDSSQGSWEGVAYGIMSLDAYLYQIREILLAIQVAALLLIVFMLLSAVVGILNSFRMMIHERTREIGTLRALGLKKPGVLLLFLGEAGLLGVSALVLGGILGFSALGLLSLPDLRAFPTFELFLKAGHLSWIVGPPALALTACLLLLCCLLAALFPARRAASMTTVDALRS